MSSSRWCSSETVNGKGVKRLEIGLCVPASGIDATTTGENNAIKRIRRCIPLAGARRMQDAPCQAEDYQRKYYLHPTEPNQTPTNNLK